MNAPADGDALPASIVVEPDGTLRAKTLHEIFADRKTKALADREQNPKYKLWERWGLQLPASGGAPVANLANAATVLEYDPTLKDLVWFDDFLQRVMTGNHAREWGDHDDIALTRYIQAEIGIPRIGRDTVAQAVVNVAYQRRRNCVMDWVSAQPWDGTERISQFFADVFGAEDTAYTRAASRNFWLSLIARIRTPGCKVDHMVILEGAQGVGKSTALQIIGGEWFTEQHESATNPKAFAEILQGKLLVEISEMDAFNRAEVNRVKQTVSCSSDRYRASYGRYATDHPRQCVLVGTTNRDDWNRDETGARRFWPIRCQGQVRLDIVAANRQQLFAEAKAALTLGEPWWHMPAEETLAEQDQRHVADPWVDPVKLAIVGKTQVTTNDVLEALGIALERRDRHAQMRAGVCLRVLGWTKTRSRKLGQREYLYIPPDI